jgi:hypothetical protein
MLSGSVGCPGENVSTGGMTCLLAVLEGDRRASIST